MSKPRIFKTSAALNKAELKFDDIVVITGIEHTVNTCFMTNTDRGGNQAVFDKLSLDKKKLSSLCYGYPCADGFWPTCRPGDNEALRRLCVALILFVEGAQAVQVFVNGKWKHIDRADVTI